MSTRGTSALPCLESLFFAIRLLLCLSALTTAWLPMHSHHLNPACARSQSASKGSHSEVAGAVILVDSSRHHCPCLLAETHAPTRLLQGGEQLVVELLLRVAT